MSLKVEHECPQCGAPVQLEDSDRVLCCAYCSVSHLLHTTQYYRFKLPVRHPGSDLQWIPYLHFKGSAFLIEGGEVTERVLQVSAAGAPSSHLPASLGFRAQTQKLRFVTGADEGEFVRFSKKPSDLLKSALVGAGAERHGQPAYIGESACVVYLPLTRTNGQVIDAVTGHVLSPGVLLDPPLVEPPVGDLLFVPALCPHCGGLLDATAQAVALPCNNCDSVWESVAGQLVKRDFMAPASRPKTALTYLPFWSFAGQQGTPATWGELADITGQPLARRQPSADAWRFWCPAFKVRPRVLLRLAERLSLTPPLAANRFDNPAPPTMPRRNRYAVTLPSREAAEMLAVALASMTFTVLDRPALFASRADLGPPTLVYLPFETIGRDLVNVSLQLAISLATMGFGETL